MFFFFFSSSIKPANNIYTCHPGYNTVRFITLLMIFSKSLDVSYFVIKIPILLLREDGLKEEKQI